MSKRTFSMGQLDRSSAGELRDMALDIVSYGRRGPTGTLHLGVDQIAQIRRTVTRTPEVMVKVSGGARDMAGVAAHLRYIGRGGTVSIQTDEGQMLQGRGVAHEIVTDWQLELCESQYRPRARGSQKDYRTKLVHNIVLSMPAGTSPDKVLAAARLFARENFALQYRYVMVLHTDQSHPHVHLVVKCEHEFEPRRRLYIRKDTLRQWREQFAALMREQGVAANATPRQVRGQIGKSYKDAIHHRLRALRAHERQLSDGPHWVRQEKTSSFLRAKLTGVLRILKARGEVLTSGGESMQAARDAVFADWRATADALWGLGHHGLAAQVERFIARMPRVQTDAQATAERWAEIWKHRPRHHGRGRPSDPRAR